MGAVFGDAVTGDGLSCPICANDRLFWRGWVSVSSPGNSPRSAAMDGRELSRLAATSDSLTESG